MSERASSNETDRRLGDAVRLGRVVSVDLAAARCVVDSGDVQSGPIPWLAPRAGDTVVWSPPTIGELVLLLCQDGELGLGVALPGIFGADFSAPDSHDRTVIVFRDGARIQYDPAAHALQATLPDGGVATLTAPAGVTVNAQGGATVNSADGATINANAGVTVNAAGGGVAITGDVNINGALHATGKISSEIDVEVGPLTLTTHKTLGVMPGGGTSGLPTP